ncbi:MAG: hypothetical protein ACOYYS_00290 [Chloroflexota bacterium]
METALRIRPEGLRDTAANLASWHAEAERTKETLSQAWARLDMGWEDYAETGIHEIYNEAIHEVGCMAVMLAQMKDALIANAERIECEDRKPFAETLQTVQAAVGEGTAGTFHFPTPAEWAALGNSIEDWFECMQNWLAGKGWRNQVVDGLGIYYDNKSGFSTYEQGIIEGGLTNFGSLIGAQRLAQLIQQGAEADGNHLYVIRDGGPGQGAGHFDQEGVVSLGDTVFDENNWTIRYRPGSAYDNQNVSARISVVHEFAHAVFNGDYTPVTTFEGVYDPNNPAHTALGPNAEEVLANILGYMSEAGENAPEIPDDLRECVVNEILPYLRGEEQP